MNKRWYGIVISLIMVQWALGQSNLITNNSFENWEGGIPAHWEQKTADFNLLKDTVEVYTGESSVRIRLTSKDTQVLGQDSIPVVGGNTYRLSLRVMDNDPAGRVRLWGYWCGFEVAGGPQPSYYSADDNNWQLYEYETEVPLGATHLNLEIRFYDVSSGWDGDAEFVIDDVSLVPLTSVKPAIFNVTDSVFRAGEDIVVRAMITDDQGIEEAKLHFLVNGADSPETVPMNAEQNHVWSSIIPGLDDQDGLRYWISASDVDAEQNQSMSDTLKILVGKTGIGTTHLVDDQGVMKYTNYKVRINGVVTSPAGVFSTDRHDEYIQDQSGGINICSSGERLVDVQMGDSLDMEGLLTQIDGRTVIMPEQISIQTRNVPQPKPIAVTCADIGEELEGALVEITNVSINGWIVAPDTTFTARISDGTVEMAMMIQEETDIDGHGNPAGDGAITITGIVSQSDPDVPYNSGYYLRPRQWSDLSVTAISEYHTSVHTFRLRQNYPNPFNPVTVIRYAVAAQPWLSGPLQVELSVYNVVGQKLATLVSGEQPVGEYMVYWDAGDYPSGVYIYRLNAGGQVQSRKMLLCR